MTWIVGAAPPIGYAVGISDIRVTFADRSESDCLQKIYPISDFVAAGFAGSVRIGFSMIDALTSRLSGLPTGCAWVPDDVANDASALAKEVFEQSEPSEQTAHSHLMLLGVHPTEDVGIPGYARTSIHILKSPDFVPEQRFGEVVSIGSGAGVAEYNEVLAGFSSDTLSLMRGEMMGAGMGFMPLSIMMQKITGMHPTPGISQHTHICIVRRGAVQIATNDGDRYLSSGEKVEFRMPQTAKSWEEFNGLVCAKGKSAHHATC
jgi:hypothetical protein